MEKHDEIYNKDLRAIDSGIFASLRTSKIPGMTAQQLLNRLNNNDKILESNFSTFLVAIKGTQAYWSRQLGDLEVWDEAFDPATFFITLSCNEYDWEGIRIFLLKMNSNLKNANNVNLDSLCVTDPVSVSTYFHYKFNSFFKHVILGGALGEVRKKNSF